MTRVKRTVNCGSICTKPSAQEGAVGVLTVTQCIIRPRSCRCDYGTRQAHAPARDVDIRVSERDEVHHIQQAA